LPPPRPSSAHAATTPAFDVSGPAVEYAKAVETELNALLFPRLRKRLEGVASKDREVTADGRRLDLGRPVPHQFLGTILYLLEKDDIVARPLGGTFSGADAGWLRSNAPRELRGIVELRNPAAHSETVSRERVETVSRERVETVSRERVETVSRERVETVRAQVMGVGCEGALVRIAKVKGAGR
jgi:hypothetical protein